MKVTSVFSMFLMAAITVVLFQNCGSFKAHDESSVGLIMSAGVKIALDPSLGLPQKGQAFRVLANTSAYPSGTQFLWDHEFGDGSTYCEQTTSFDKSFTTFLCPDSGSVKVYLFISTPDGSQDLATLDLFVGDSSGEGPNPTPTPTPMPTVETGASLYNQHCSGCHGPLATSTKRNRSLTQLNNAITGVATMRNLSTLTTQQRQLIIDALNQ
jgi:hypothetical protein